MKNERDDDRGMEHWQTVQQWEREEMDYERMDKAALRNALLGLHICPNPRCGRAELKPVGPMLDEVYGCAQCRETWYIPTEKDRQEGDELFDWAVDPEQDM